MVRKKTRFIGLVLVVLIAISLGLYLLIRPSKVTAPVANTPTAPVVTPVENKEPAPSFDKNQYPLDKPDSLWAVVNKKRPLPADYVPGPLVVAGNSTLRTEAAQALKQLLQSASVGKVPLSVISGYRSYSTQKNLYNFYVQKDGQAAADTYSARPGYSEHQTGLAADLGNQSGQCDLEICFSTTEGGKWLAANAHLYGFTIRYAENKTAITGYQYEPWHLRYVGADLATELYAKKQTLEEFFGFPAAPGY